MSEWYQFRAQIKAAEIVTYDEVGAFGISAKTLPRRSQGAKVALRDGAGARALEGPSPTLSPGGGVTLDDTRIASVSGVSRT